jgi:peptidoglycan-associated lipoprotein
MIRTSRLAPALLVALAAAACGKKPAPAPAPAPVAAAPDSSAIRDSLARLEQARRDSIARAQAEADRLRSEREKAMANARNTLSATIYFDFDSDALTDASRSALDAKLGILNANPAVRLRVAGHTDERGSDEYNLALGQRRAAAAKRYLTQHGIADERIEVISYGEERPAVEGHDESAWSKNRRDEFEITAGGDQLTAATPR